MEQLILLWETPGELVQAWEVVLAALDRRDGSRSLTRSVSAEENLFREPRRLPVVLSRLFHSDAVPPR